MINGRALCVQVVLKYQLLVPRRKYIRVLQSSCNLEATLAPEPILFPNVTKLRWIWERINPVWVPFITYLSGHSFRELSIAIYDHQWHSSSHRYCTKFLRVRPNLDPCRASIRRIISASLSSVTERDQSEHSLACSRSTNGYERSDYWSLDNMYTRRVHASNLPILPETILSSSSLA